MTLLRDNAARIESLEVVGGGQSVLQHLTGPFIELRCVRLVLPLRFEIAHPWTGLLSAPSLRMINMNKLESLDMLPIPTNQITHLNVFRNPSAMNSFDCLSLLKLLPALVVGRFCLAESTTSPVTPPELVEFALTFLEILDVMEGINKKVDRDRVPRPFLGFLSLPRLRELAIPEIWYEDDAASDIQELQNRSGCLLQRLSLYLTPWEELGGSTHYGYQQALPGVQIHLDDRHYLAYPHPGHYCSYSSD
ncbi:hypothetical protein FB451DRAFT_1287210 [Mycena latifolia]|nr:hypothetical protein FB451DRAFT_1287210 [Mycena latifolia]